MYVIEQITIPLPVPGKQGFVTILKNMPRFVIMDLQRGRIGTLEELAIHCMIPEDNIDYQYTFSRSCVYELMTDNVQAVYELCDFSTAKRNIEPKSQAV